MERSEQVSWDEVQGLVLSGYPKLHFAAYIPWRFASPDVLRSKEWLRHLIGRLRVVGVKEHGSARTAINVAVTSTGLVKLGIANEELQRFPIEFREGMAPARKSDDYLPRRCNILGDIGKNSPQHWHWGGWDANGKIDGLLLLYATSENQSEQLIKKEIEEARIHGLEFLDTENNDGNALILKGRLYTRRGQDLPSEHFGFVDGISQPIIAGTKREKQKHSTKKPRSAKEAQMHVVKPGEFILGYFNERGTRATYSDPPGSKATKTRSRDLARNGTYLVFRQLEQDVSAFNKAISETAKNVRGNDSSENQEWVAARFIGRKRDGAPLISAPIGADVHKEQRRNDFLYYFEDRFGLSCPLGAHIRRANPRDLVGPDPMTALRLSRMHRILRRGRPYGRDKQEPRGMLFICLNADIAGQFELIQHSWINNGRFAGLYSETDPLLNYAGEERTLTIQRRPTSECVAKQTLNYNFNQFVTVRGGAYFFLPGIQALRFLAG